MPPDLVRAAELPATSPLALARVRVAAMQQRLQAAGLGFRRPPPEPTTCCGRGCNGCVWEGFHEATDRWLAEAEALLRP